MIELANSCYNYLNSFSGVVEEPALDECSGLAASRSQPGVLWAHNDHGGETEVIAFYDDGSKIGISL